MIGRVSVVSLMILACTPVALAAGDEVLKNPDFAATTDGWELTVYGGKPVRDSQILHDGKPALRIAATEPSDAALAQEVQLRPGAIYRLTGWVRTRGLDAHGARVFGTFQIQQPVGRTAIATGSNHGGDTEWSEVAVDFEAPPGGLTRVVVFFAGFGKATGTAWFADLNLREIDTNSATIKVTTDAVCPGTINPYQYGQFIEYLCNLVPAMWAEKVYDGGFEGLTPYKFAYLRETDFREKPWYPSGATNRAEYKREQNKIVSGDYCQRISVTGDTPCTVGISQDGIAVEADKPCTFSCYLRQQGITKVTQVTLHNNGKVLAAGRITSSDRWMKFSIPLVPSATATNATLSISFGGPGTIWIDNVSLMPQDAIGGWRPDVVAAVKALKPGIIRFGGSALDEPGFGEFDWKNTIGDPDKRKPFRAWGGLQPVGPGLEEVVQFCQLVDAEPLLCVRVAGRTPKEAAEQVEYFNGPVTTPMGKLRAANGHPQPYRVKYWQVGNERSGKEYEARLPAFCKAMKELDPSITLMSSYPTAGVIKGAGAYIDYVSPHHYDCGDLAGTEQNLVAAQNLCKSQSPQKPIRLAVTEWNTTAGDWGPKRARLWPLENALACSRYQNLLHRHCDAVEIANRSNLTNSFCSGIIQTDNHRLYKTPTYYAQQLYATFAGNRPIKIESTLSPQFKPDVSATLSADGKTVTLFAINSSLTDISRPIDLTTFGNEGQEVELWTLGDRKRAGEPDVTNSFDEPDRVMPVRSHFAAASGKFEFRFPALSLSVLRWRVVK